jgi:hypothetical protein
MVYHQAHVRFHPDLVTSSSRMPTRAEQWALEDFEFHARTCKRCDLEMQKLDSRSSPTLCKSGTDLVRPLFVYFRFADNKFLTNAQGEGMTIIEIPLQFSFVRQVLRLKRYDPMRCKRPQRPFNLVRHCSARWCGSSRGWEYICVEQYRLKML